MIKKLPLFPLDTVLFPGAPLPLHIFEERYRLMISRCLEQKTPFGVVLIQSGEQVGGPATTYSIGTTAQIEKSERLDDGRYLIYTQGERRFRVQYALQRTPYIVASVALLPEESGAGIVDQARELHALHERYWQRVAHATGFMNEVEDLSQEAVEMSYQLAHRLQVDNWRKQRWLEADVSTRLREITVVLRAELALLPNAPSGKEPGEWFGPGSWN